MLGIVTGKRLREVCLRYWAPPKWVGTGARPIFDYLSEDDGSVLTKPLSYVANPQRDYGHILEEFHAAVGAVFDKVRKDEPVLNCFELRLDTYQGRVCELRKRIRRGKPSVGEEICWQPLAPQKVDCHGEVL